MSKSSPTNSQWLLADRALTPILSSVPLPSPTTSDETTKHEQTQLQSLTSLTTTAITAFDSAARLGLGLPQRIFVETQPGGPVILHAFLNPAPRKQQNTRAEEVGDDELEIVEQAREDLRPLTATTDGAGEQHEEEFAAQMNGLAVAKHPAQKEPVETDEEETSAQQSPLLVASVVASNLGEAKRAARMLEMTGREIQQALMLEQQEEDSHDTLEVETGG